MIVIVEGVETAEQLRALRDVGAAWLRATTSPAGAGRRDRGGLGRRRHAQE
jgi:hypothetical protein